MKKYQLLMSMMTLLVAPLGFAAIPFGGDFNCPMADANPANAPTLEEMKAPLMKGTIWLSNGSDSGIVFVDEAHEFYDAGGNLTPIGQSFVPEGKTDPDITGSFKINYQYQATECRRQVVLKEEALAGIYRGETIIEICRPSLMESFAKINAAVRAQQEAAGVPLGTDFMTHIYPQFEAEAVKLEALYEQEIEKARPLYDEAEDLEDQAHEKFDSAECKANDGSPASDACLLAWAKLKRKVQDKYDEARKIEDAAYAHYDKARSLRNLKVPDVKNQAGDPAVRYLKDKDGFVLPRFAVTLENFSYMRELVDVYDKQIGQYVQKKSCTMLISHATRYAGLAKNYNWSMNYETPVDANVWTFDQNGETAVAEETYTTDQDKDQVVDYNFLDWNEIFQ